MELNLLAFYLDLNIKTVLIAFKKLCQRLFKELIMGIVFSKEDENYDKENGTPTVLLLGNGFDLQLGLKSRYEDFLLYLFFLKV